MDGASVGLAVLLGVVLLAVAGRGQGKVDVRVDDLILQRAVADLQIDRPGLALVHHVMAVALAGSEAGGHAGLHNLLAGLGDEGALAFGHIDDLGFMAVPLSLPGARAWLTAYNLPPHGIAAPPIAT